MHERGLLWNMAGMPRRLYRLRHNGGVSWEVAMRRVFQVGRIVRMLLLELVRHLAFQRRGLDRIERRLSDRALVREEDLFLRVVNHELMREIGQLRGELNAIRWMVMFVMAALAVALAIYGLGQVSAPEAMS